MSPSIDVAALHRLRLAGGRELVEKMVALFLEHTPRRLAALREGTGRADWDLVERTAHSMKSSAAHLGLGELRARAELAESLARDGRGDDVLPLLQDLDQAYLAVRPALVRVLQA